MSTYTDAERFLQEVFGSDYGTRAILANLNPAVHVRSVDQLDAERDCYWSIAAYPPGYTGTNTEAAALEVRALVIDDVGTKVPEGAVELALGKPTRVTLTSAGNYQWAYRLTKPVAVSDWAGFFGGVEALIAHPLEAKAAQTLMRLPMGRNTKPQNNRFQVQGVEIEPGPPLDPDTIPRVKVSRPGPPAGSIRPWVHHIKEMVAILPNDVEYDEWIAVGQRIAALAVDQEDGREAWLDFSSRTTLKVYDEAFSDGKWPFKPDHTRGGLLVDAVQKIGGPAVDAWWQMEAPYVFDDGVDLSWVGTPDPAAKLRTGITATPYKWTDPDKIPPRDWLYGKILIRKFISMTVAPGGVGKSSLIAVETLAQVTGRNLLGEKSAGALRVWLWNLEDPGEETTRKLQAAALHYGISEADIGGRLYVDSGREQRLVVAVTERNAPTIVRPVISALVEQIRLRRIDVVVIDPFVSCHEVPENDNTAQDMVVKEWGRVAELGGCAVHLVDHTRKAMNGVEVTTESSRGGKAKTDAARVVRVVNRMSEADGAAYGIMNIWGYFNTFNDKANMAPPVDRRDWFQLESVELGNGGTAASAFAGGVGAGQVHGDSVGVAIRWVPPSATDLVTGDNFKKMVEEMGTEEWRKDPRAGDKWIGVPASNALGLLRHSPRDRKQILAVLSAWFKAGLLKEVAQLDAHRKERKFIKIAGGF